MPDPRADSIEHPDPQKAAKNVKRLVPSFKYLQMIMYREKAVQEILAIMAEDGVPCPKACREAIMKLWFLMEIPWNVQRVG